MLAAVQIFNNPNIQFKSESFIVLIIISWTYLMHAYFRENKIEYRYFEQKNTRKKFDLTKKGAYKYWELERCLNEEGSPIDKITSQNLKFLIGLRHEIEHQMTTKIDDILSARFQATCLNYNTYLKQLFPKETGIEKYLSFSLQFSSLNEQQINQLQEYKDLPANISTYIQSFDRDLTDDDFNDNRFSYCVLFIPKTANRKGQADRVIEFVSPDSEIAKSLNKEYVVIKDRERQKFLPTRICEILQEMGYSNFKLQQHTDLWRQFDAKNPVKGYGVQVIKQWYWYDTWLDFVKNHCQENSILFK